MQALWDILAENWRDLLSGTWLTVQLVAIAAVLGFVLAVPVALARLSPQPFRAAARPRPIRCSSAARRCSCSSS